MTATSTKLAAAIRNISVRRARAIRIISGTPNGASKAGIADLPVIAPPNRSNRVRAEHNLFRLRRI